MLALTQREGRDPLLGKKFYDSNEDGQTDFTSGEFTVLARDIVGENSTDYWCERDPSGDFQSPRVIERFKRDWVEECVESYDNE